MGIGTFEGRAAIRRFLEDWLRSYEELRYALGEVVDLGNGVVLAVTRQTHSWLAALVAHRYGQCGFTSSYG